MKPSEFDELIRQKFNQNDFAYNPQNWDKLAEKMEGQPSKKRLMIWWTPLIGIAAALTVSMGFAGYMRHAVPVNTGVNNNIVKTTTANTISHELKNNSLEKTGKIEKFVKSVFRKSKNAKPIALNNREGKKDYFALSMDNAIVSANQNYFAKKSVIKEKVIINLLDKQEEVQLTKKKKISLNKEEVVYKTFKEQASTKVVKSSIILSGGVNYGSNSSGFMIGATGRTMITERVYIESDIAFTGSNNTQKTATMVCNNDYESGKLSVAARTTADANAAPVVLKNDGAIMVSNKAYNLYYAQITPSIGYKLLNRVAIGIGPDFQQALADNRPAPSILDRGNIQVAPMFDIGFIGKSEFTLNGNLKAAIYYREGINNIITPMNKYIDRNYLQFQLKYALFNKVK